MKGLSRISYHQPDAQGVGRTIEPIEGADSRTGQGTKIQDMFWNETGATLLTGVSVANPLASVAEGLGRSCAAVATATIPTFLGVLIEDIIDSAGLVGCPDDTWGLVQTIGQCTALTDSTVLAGDYLKAKNGGTLEPDGTAGSTVRTVDTVAVALEAYAAAGSVVKLY